MSVLAIGGAVVLGGLMPWRRRLWLMLSKALDVRVPGGRVALDKTGLALIVSGGLGVAAFIGGAGGLAILGGSHAGGGSAPAFSYSAPNTPACNATAFAATGDSLRVACGAFVGSGDDTQDSLHVQVDTAGGDFSSPQYWNVKLGAVLTDTVTALDSGSVVDVRVAVKGTNGGWSAFDSIMAVDMVASSAFFQMNYSSGAAPNAGWTGTSGPGADATVTQMDALGPSSEAGYRHELDYIDDNGGDGYWSWNRDFGDVAPFVYTDTAYFRWRHRWVTGTDCRGLAQFGTGELTGVWRNKTLAINEIGGDPNAGERVFVTIECRPAAFGGLDWRFVISKGGGVDAIGTAYFSVTTNWVDVQVELIYSSEASATDGCYSIWVDTNTYGSPSATCAAGIEIEQGGEIRFGFYYNNGEYSDGTIGWDHVGFEIDDAFDSAWDN